MTNCGKKGATDSHFLCALCFTDGITEHCRTNAQMNGGRLQRINQDEKLKIAQDLPQVFTREMKETCEGFHVSEELTVFSCLIVKQSTSEPMICRRIVSA